MFDVSKRILWDNFKVHLISVSHTIHFPSFIYKKAKGKVFPVL